MHACMKNLALNNLINYTEGAYKKKKKSISVCQANTGIQFAKMGIKPNTIPNRKTSIIFICSKGKKKGNIYP